MRRHSGRVPVIAIPELSRHLGDLADRFYGKPSADMRVIGITGTNGKTSCSQYIAQALAQQSTDGASVPCGVIGTLGYGAYGELEPGLHTTPDAIQMHHYLADMHAREVGTVVIEVSSHALVQGRVNGVRFDTAVFTNLSRDHLDYHDSMAAYGRAKRRLFDAPGLQHAVINVGDEFGRAMLVNLPDRVAVLTYGLDDDIPSTFDVPATLNHAGHLGASLTDISQQGFTMRLATPWGEGEMTSGLLGRFNAINLLAVAAVMKLSGFDLQEALWRVSQCTTVAGRMERFSGEGKWIQRLPVVSSLVIMVVGFVMAVRALMEAGIVIINL